MTFFQLGLIGYPLGHSLSPLIHNAALAACGLQGSYSLFPVAPDDQRGLRDLLSRVRARDIAGLNVTIPHKQNVAALTDELTPAAQAIGAVNTVYLRDEKLVGDNTDAPGFLSDLKKVRGEENDEGRKSALVLGAGGAARAVVHALLGEGWRVAVSSRRNEQAQGLVASFSNSQKLSTCNLQPATRNSQPATFNLIVNATPLGMFPRADETPLPNAAFFHADLFVYDLVYNPRETKLTRQARTRGARAAGGIGMLVEQAALAFALWTGCNPPRETLREALDRQP
ncbi:MAG: shikimate dehydrogenase [Anaerolineales bacterium]|nr:shikimate dehydrogenase [Anaerolineales bacterium]